MMQVGLIGAGNMAAALARGWNRPVYVADAVFERAQHLAAEVAGTAYESNHELARASDLVVLCHKPGQLDVVARDIGQSARAVASILGGVGVSELDRAFPATPVYRFMPNVAAEVRSAVLCYCPGSLASEGPQAEVLELFSQLGTLIEIEDGLMDTATALCGCAPAFFALTVEALAEAGVGFGLQHSDAIEMTAKTMAGTAALLQKRANDVVSLRRQVTSPGGSTARGVAALERAGLRAAFYDAVEAVAARQRP